MQIKDLFVSEALTTLPGQNPAQSGQPDQEVGKLTATVSDLQKQIADLQKAALQQAPAQQGQPKPGEAGQQQQPKAPVGAGQGNGQLAPTAGQAPAQAGGMLDMIKKLAGIQPQQKPGQPMGQAPTQQTQAPGVNQTPQMTALKIKQDLARTQGKST